MTSGEIVTVTVLLMSISARAGTVGLWREPDKGIWRPEAVISVNVKDLSRAFSGMRPYGDEAHPALNAAKNSSFVFFKLRLQC